MCHVLRLSPPLVIGPQVPSKVFEISVQVKITLFGNLLRVPASFQGFQGSDGHPHLCGYLGVSNLQVSSWAPRYPEVPETVQSPNVHVISTFNRLNLQYYVN